MQRAAGRLAGPGRQHRCRLRVGVHDDQRLGIGGIRRQHDERQLDRVHEVEVAAGLRFGLAPSRDVDHHAAHVHRSTELVDLDPHAVLEVHDPSVGRHEPVVDLEVLAAPDGVAVAATDLVHVVGVHLGPPEPRLEEGRRGVAQQVGRPLVHVQAVGLGLDLFPHDGVDARGQLDVAAAQVALGLRHRAEGEGDGAAGHAVDDDGHAPTGDVVAQRGEAHPDGARHGGEQADACAVAHRRDGTRRGQHHQRGCEQLRCEHDDDARQQGVTERQQQRETPRPLEPPLHADRPRHSDEGDVRRHLEVLLADGGDQRDQGEQQDEAGVDRQVAAPDLQLVERGILPRTALVGRKVRAPPHAAADPRSLGVRWCDAPTVPVEVLACRDRL
ncbi:MAG: hypothetical protein R2690_07450 [Acidimicrobiales bacterium]